VISNGRGPTEPDAVLIDAGVSVVEQFKDEHTTPSPTRADHIRRISRPTRIGRGRHATPSGTARQSQP
jgi:hypothetical protein